MTSSERQANGEARTHITELMLSRKIDLTRKTAIKKIKGVKIEILLVLTEKNSHF